MIISIVIVNIFAQWLWLKKKETRKRTIQKKLPAGIKPRRTPHANPAAI
jgi:hypothetical protein